MNNQQIDQNFAAELPKATKPAQKVRHYLYAIIPASASCSLGAIGIGGAEVTMITVDDVAAVVSRGAAERIRPERRNLAAHSAVLKHLNAATTVLPMSFGTIAASEDAIRDALHRNQELFLSQMKRVAGKIEMGLRVEWDVPNVFEYFVAHQTELRAQRDELLMSGQPSRDDMIRIGQLFERLLNHERDRLFQRIATILSRSGVVVKKLPPRSEREVMNLACLIPREQQEGFESVVCEAATGLDSTYMFNVSGPWSPHNFVEISL